MIEAAALIKSTIDRILRLKEEIDALNDDIKEIYAEAKAHGLDKAALGALVNEIRKAEKLGADRINEAATILDMYRDAYEGAGNRSPSRAHTHTHAYDPARETNSHPAVALPDDAGNAAVVPPKAVACEAGAPDPLASHPIPEFVRPDHADDSTDDSPQAPSVGSPSVAGSAVTICSDIRTAQSAMISGVSPPLADLAGPSGPAPLGDFDPADDMPAFLRRSKPPITELTA